MNNNCRSAILSLAFLMTSASGIAAAPSSGSASKIFGTYMVTSEQGCSTPLAANRPTPTPSHFSYQTDGANRNFIVSDVPFTTYVTASRYLLKINPKTGVMTADRVFKSTRRQGVAFVSGPTIVIDDTWASKTLTFVIDKASDTLLITNSTLTQTDAYYRTTFTSQGGNYMTPDGGQTFIGAPPTAQYPWSPIALSTAYEISSGITSYTDLVCNTTIQGTRVSTSY